METKTYTYGDSSWADLLTQYNGKAITYDGIGNMLTYNGSTYTWMGRELRKITNGSNTYSYKYNADGIRTSKTVNGTTTEFFLNGSQILAQKTGDSVMRFFYDSTGKRVGFANGTMLFYYLYNVQGDVIAIVRAATGQIVAKYSYDAWGKCTVTNATGYAVGDKNPFRYRGYYYDTETGLYYLNSRYYNPEFGRFISVDTVMGVNSDISTYNLFAYCGNNPITRYDNGGMSWNSIVFIMHTLPYTLHGMNTIAVWIGIDTAAIGGSFLNMTKKGDTYHADFDCWQQYFGYNDFYDLVFDWATSCVPAKFRFTYSGQEYVIWAWKGDYINMGAGAEMGIYIGGGPHWRVDKSLAMSMCMQLQYNGKTIIEPYRDYTWWITGFNPQYLNTSAGSLTASFSIWFKDPGMFHAFRSSKPWGWSFGIMQGFYTASFTL